MNEPSKSIVAVLDTVGKSDTQSMVMIPTTEYADLIRRDDRVETVRAFIENNHGTYIECDVIANILGFEILRKEENENG